MPPVIGEGFQLEFDARLVGIYLVPTLELPGFETTGVFDLRPYTERLAEAEMKTGLADAMVIGQAFAIRLLPSQHHGRGGRP